MKTEMETMDTTETQEQESKLQAENTMLTSEEERRIEHARQTVMNQMDIPRHYRPMQEENFLGYEKEKADAYTALVTERRSLFIHGDPGTGKTHLAIVLMKRFYNEITFFKDQDKRYLIAPFFLPSIEFLYALKKTYQEDGSEDSLLGKYTHRELLVLDDLGAERPTDWRREIFYLFIDRIYRNEQQIIITSNLNLGQIAESLDDRIASRISEICTIIKLNGKDHRLQK